MSASSKIKVGEVMLSDEVEFNRGTVRAGANAKVVSVFFGTVEGEEEVDIEERLNLMGWTRNTMFELLVGICVNGENQMFQFLFLASSPQEAAKNAIAVAEKAEEGSSSKHWEPRSEIFSFCIRGVKIGHVEDGMITRKQGNVFASWDLSDGQEWEDFNKELVKACG